MLREAFQLALTDWPPVLRYSKRLLHEFYSPTIKIAIIFEVRPQSARELIYLLVHYFLLPNPRAAKKVAKGKKGRGKEKKDKNKNTLFRRAHHQPRLAFSFLLVTHLAPTHLHTHTPPPPGPQDDNHPPFPLPLFPPTLPPAPPIINLLDYPSLRSLRFGVSVKRQPPASSCFLILSLAPSTYNYPSSTRPPSSPFLFTILPHPSTHFLHA